MQKLPDAENNSLKIFAGVLGLIQGGSWMVLSVLCIILYNQDVENVSVETYMDQVMMNIYKFFLINDESHIDGQITKASVFTGFMWAYLVLDLVWVLASLNTKKQNRGKGSLRLWSLATSLVSLLDLVLVILLSIDYQNCFDEASSAALIHIGAEQLCANIILPVLIIAAKGFTLWIVNIIFAIVVFRISRQKSKNVQHLRTENWSSQMIVSPQPYFQVGYSPYSSGSPIQNPQFQQSRNEYSNIQRPNQLEQSQALRSPPRRF